MHIVYRQLALAGITARAVVFFNVMAPPRGSGLVVLVDEGEHVVFGQLFGVHPGLGVMNSDPFFPRPEQALRVADAEETKKNKKTNTHKQMRCDSVEIGLKHLTQGFPRRGNSTDPSCGPKQGFLFQNGRYSLEGGHRVGR